jgi:hypothetical protein
MDGVVVTGSYNRWQAWAGTEVIGTMRAWLRPDQRCVLMFRGCRPDAYPPLLARAVAEFDRDLWTKAGEAELPRQAGSAEAVAWSSGSAAPGCAGTGGAGGRNAEPVTSAAISTRSGP